MAEGTIKKLTDKGFGFIKTGGTKDLYFHSSSLQGVSFEDLHEGQKVSYTNGTVECKVLAFNGKGHIGSEGVFVGSRDLICR